MQGNFAWTSRFFVYNPVANFILPVAEDGLLIQPFSHLAITFYARSRSCQGGRNPPRRTIRCSQCSWPRTIAWQLDHYIMRRMKGRPPRLFFLECSSWRKDTNFVSRQFCIVRRTTSLMENRWNSSLQLGLQLLLLDYCSAPQATQMKLFLCWQYESSSIRNLKTHQIATLSQKNGEGRGLIGAGAPRFASELGVSYAYVGWYHSRNGAGRANEYY